ncbi:cyclophilin-like protein [Cricetibacter osteomyelitidis]|uniref:Cyclophilin-like protein n=2 Tax=Cricetibacter osteomyelitidis TaxID=1521931 RepID=A0A4R2SPQ9_9PAST|nr:cyclophilin-like protein [Cricetibacter osteomyelitidis]
MPQNRIQLIIGQHRFTAKLADNPAAAELKALLPLQLTMQDLHRNEKYAALPHSLPSQNQPVGRIEIGDVMLYQGDTLVIFYENFTTPYSYTRLAKIQQPAQLKATLGKGTVDVMLVE